MLFKYLIILLSSVYSILAVSTTFIEKGQRAEIFELTDNEIPVFRLTMSNRTFALLKQKADFGGLGSSRANLESILKNFYRLAGEGFDDVTNTNFFKRFPNHNVTELFPELNIGEDGFPHLDKEEVMKGYDMDIKNYISFDFVSGNIMAEFLDRHPYFKLVKYSTFFTQNSSNNQNVPEQLTKIETYSKKITLNSTDVKSIISEQLLLEIENSFNNQTMEIFDVIEDNIINEVPINENIMNGNETNIVDDSNNLFNITENSYEYTTNDVEEEVTSDIFSNFEYDTFTTSIDEIETTTLSINESPTQNIEEEEDYYEDSEYKFKTKKAHLTVEIAGKQLQYDKITFSLGGQYSRKLIKPNFNLKIRGGRDLYGRSQFKLRSDFTEPTFLRSKLTSDVHNRLGLTSISANYATLYINDEYMGLFILTDAIKQSWIERIYGEKDTQSLYKCNSSNLTFNSRYGCSNEDDDFHDYTEWMEFLKRLDEAQCASDIEDIFDVDHFITEMAIEYLIGAWDHIQQIGHNFFMYKQTNGKWKYLIYDFDHEFGINIDRVFLAYIFDDLPERLDVINTDYPNYSFSDWAVHHHIIDILILKDPTRFETILKDIVTKVFNPATLFPHINELKEFIRPYVILDKTPDEKGNCPGRINESAEESYTFEEWNANTEFTTVSTIQYNAYGLKYWILAKYRYVCKNYNMECDPVYMDEGFEYPIDKEVEFTGYYNDDNDDDDDDDNQQCWSEPLGFPCCSLSNQIIYYEDESGNWGIDENTNDWCGILPISELKEKNKSSCWSEKLGYSCCTECKVYYRDEYGAWGYENDWCGIQPRCRK